MPCALWSDYPELDRSNCKGTPEELKAASARVVRFFRKVGPSALKLREPR